ncbi:DNA polymerase epsilon subunit 2 [Balamuthia mandrillaris]
MNTRQLVTAFKRHGLSINAAALALLQSSLKEVEGGDAAEFVNSLLLSIDKPSLTSSVIEEATLQKLLDGIKGQQNVDIAQEAFKVIGAFDFPHFDYNTNRKCFEPSEEESPSIHGEPEAKSALFKERWWRVYQKVLRHFAKQQQEQNLLPVESLIGRSGAKCFVVGLLSHIGDSYCLEDPTGAVPVDLSKVTLEDGFLTEGSIVVVEGTVLDGKLLAHIVRQPLIEDKKESCRLFGPDTDYFGGAPPQRLQKKLQRYKEQQANDMWVILSNVSLDQPSVFERLETLFSAYASMEPPPPVFVLMGNFISRPKSSLSFQQQVQHTNADSWHSLSHCFEQLAQLICSYPSLVRQSRFVFVPGPKDPGLGGSHVLPRPALPPSICQKLRARVPGAIFTTNPCRIRYCEQEIVIFREDLVNKLRRHSVLEDPNGSNDTMEHKMFCTLLGQATMCPLSLMVRPVYWKYDFALGLYPVPDMFVMADDGTNLTETTMAGCNCVSLASFDPSFSFVVYRPSLRQVEFSQLPKQL